MDIGGSVQSRADPKVYVVQTGTAPVQRCILMTTDPGDLVLDPTCGSGTTAYVAEQWGRRWITIDTSRVALALARARIMGARYPYYLLADSKAGQAQEAKLSRRLPSEEPTYGDIRQGFVYQRVPHITLRAIANNAEIDVIWEQYERQLAPLRRQLSVVSGAWSVQSEAGPPPVTAAEAAVQAPTAGTTAPDSDDTQHAPLSPNHSSLAEWDIPRQRPDDWPAETEPLLAEFWKTRIARQKEIDASIAAKADYEYLYDKPYEDKQTVRVAGPFTVESISPHRTLAVDEDGEFIEGITEEQSGYGSARDFAQVILDNLRTAGVQQAHKEDRIEFTSLTPWPGKLVCGEGIVKSGGGGGPSLRRRPQSTSPALDSGLRRCDDDAAPSLSTNHSSHDERRAAVFIGPEFGTVSRPDLVEAAREAAEAGFDLLIACAFNYDAHATEFERLGRIPVLKARMNADLHMANDLKNTGQGNLFVVFGEPDITVASEEWLVASEGKRVAPYDIFKLVSGVDSLAEVNGLDGEDLRDYAALSCRREVWDYLTATASRVLGAGEHRGGTGQTHDGGVSAVAWHCAGIAGRAGNLSDLMRKAGTDTARDFRALVERLRRDQQNAQRSHQGTHHSSLTTLHTPLITRHWLQATVHGVDVFHPNTGEVRSDGPDGIACWFIDTDYNEESFFVRHAYFLGASDPYKSLKTTLKGEINAEAWETLKSDTSRPFSRPESGRIAVKVINHLGDEVMKVFRVAR